MQDKPVPAPTTLLWQGPETVEEARRLVSALEGPVALELHLPANLHHTLYTRFHSEAAAEGVEEVSLEGDGALLRRIEDLPGVEGLAALREWVEGAGLKVRIVSPSPAIILYS